MKNINVRSTKARWVKLGATLFMVCGLVASQSAHAALDKSTEAKLVKICHALKSDSKIRLHRTIKQSRLGYKQIAKGLVCNGKSAMDFALLNNANNTASYLARKANIDYDAMLAKR